MRPWIDLIESQDWRLGLRQLSQDARDAGVDFQLDANEDSINLIEIARMTAKKGAAAEFMLRLCALADQNQLEIYLHVAGGMRKLVSYYESFGFEMDMGEFEHETEGKGEHPDADEHSFGYELSMYRIPRYPS